MAANTIRCPVCGSINSMADEFCMKCGARLDASGLAVIASTRTERLFASIVHLSILVSWLIPLFWLPWLACLLVWFFSRDRSQYVSFQSLQALVFQFITLGIGNILLNICRTSLPGVLMGVPLLLLGGGLIGGGSVYAVIAGIFCFQGRDFRYIWLGDLLKGRKNR